MGQKSGLFVLVFGLVVVVLCATSSRRVTGDGREYIALGERLAHFQSPALPSEAADALKLSESPPRDRYGERQLLHFWVFPLLAVPFIWILSSNPVLAFAWLNAVLLVVAFAYLTRRAGVLAAAFVCAGPTLWWIDKSQVEVFTVSLLAIGCASLEHRPRAALAFALVSTQNPPAASLVALLALERLVRQPRSLRVQWPSWLAAFALCALHPAYYLWRLGRVTPLVPANDLRLPAIRTMLAFVTDSNIGLLANAPLTGLVIIVLFVAGAAGFVSRNRLIFAALVALIFLTAFAQAPNVNSGGTPGMSRYALWLIPLAIVLWPASRPSRRREAGLAILVWASVVWSAVYFRPSAGEDFLRPTRLASWLWKAHPSWENPLPEIFAERLRHQDGVNPLASTPDCSKVLIQEGTWPTGCTPMRTPTRCAAEHALCYANRRDDGGYEFVATSRRGGVALR